MKLRVYRYLIQFIGRQHGEQILVSPYYKIGGFYKYIDAPFKLITIERFSPLKREVKRDYEIIGKIKILQKSIIH